MYAVFRLEREITVEVYGKEKELPLSTYHGMIGAIPCFDNKEDAEECADGRYEIVKIKAKAVFEFKPDLATT